MLVEWEGEKPPDAGGWVHVLREALGAEAVSYWVRFYRGSEGWRFDLEHHQTSDWDKPTFKRADETIALHVYTLLVESGRPLDPGWTPFAPSPPEAIVPTPAPAPSGEAQPPAAEAAPVVAPTAPPEPVRETKTESVWATLAAPVLEPEPFSEPLPPPAPPRAGGGASGLRSSICPPSCWSPSRCGSPETRFSLAPRHHPPLRPPPR